MLVALAGLVMLALALSPRAQAQSDQQCFPQTGLCISGRIKSFWEQNGGLPVFGYPITPQRPEPTADGTFESQWFERTRLELHPENAPPYDVLLGLAGVVRLQQQGREWQTFPKSDPNAPAPPGGCVYFAETQHRICGLFLTAYRSYGLNFPGVAGISPEESLALFGLPISEPMSEVLENGQLHTVQWFQRARFEEHPANTPPYNVLFGRLGAEILNTYMSSPGNKPPVVGTVWRWEGTTLSDGSRIQATDPSRYTIQFSDDSTVKVKADCNQVSGVYTLQGSSMTIRLGPSTMAFCPPDSQDQVYLQQLGAVVSYAYDSAGALILNLKADGGNMRFIP
jgi:heat shock protein HslJ